MTDSKMQGQGPTNFITLHSQPSAGDGDLDPPALNDESAMNNGSAGAPEAPGISCGAMLRNQAIGPMVNKWVWH